MGISDRIRRQLQQWLLTAIARVAWAVARLSQGSDKSEDARNEDTSNH